MYDTWERGGGRGGSGGNQVVTRGEGDQSKWVITVRVSSDKWRCIMEEVMRIQSRMLIREIVRSRYYGNRGRVRMIFR